MFQTNSNTKYFAIFLHYTWNLIRYIITCLIRDKLRSAKRTLGHRSLVLYFLLCSILLNHYGNNLTPWRLSVNRLLRFTFLALLFLYYKIYAFIELTPIDYFTTFAIKFLHWPVRDASRLMSLFFGTNCLGRFLGVLLSFKLRPRTMLIANLLLTTVAYVILFPVKNLPELLWASAALAGLGMATTFATTILWVSESVAISGRVASVVVASGSFGSIVMPQIVGRLFDVPAAGGPMSMVYVLVTSALAHITVFTCMLIFVSRCFGERQ